MKNHNINQVMLVTDNGTLAGWIMNPKKNKAYTAYMERAVKPYRAGSFKEIVIGIGLCEPRKAEKSYKYCKEEYVVESRVKEDSNNDEAEVYQIDPNNYRTIIDDIEEDKSIPVISGINEV